MPNYRNVWLAASLCATVLLTACGGDDDGTAAPAYDGPTSGAVFTAENVNDIATGVAEMALAEIDVPISPDDLLRTSKDSNKSSTRFHGFRTFQQKAETLLKGRLDAERNRLSSMGVRATESEDLECDSGSVLALSPSRTRS